MATKRSPSQRSTRGLPFRADDRPSPVPRVAPPPPGGRPAHDPARPFWRFTPVASGHAGCPDGTCAAHNGVTLPDSSPWWRKHTPPLHWGCLCRLESLTAREAFPLLTSAAALAQVPAAQPDFGDGLQPGPTEPTQTLRAHETAPLAGA